MQQFYRRMNVIVEINSTLIGIHISPEGQIRVELFSSLSQRDLSIAGLRPADELAESETTVLILTFTISSIIDILGLTGGLDC